MKSLKRSPKECSAVSLALPDADSTRASESVLSRNMGCDLESFCQPDRN